VGHDVKFQSLSSMTLMNMRIPVTTMPRPPHEWLTSAWRSAYLTTAWPSKKAVRSHACMRVCIVPPWSRVTESTSIKITIVNFGLAERSLRHERVPLDSALCCHLGLVPLRLYRIREKKQTPDRECSLLVVFLYL
jgi:hypothetical protein